MKRNIYTGLVRVPEARDRENIWRVCGDEEKYIHGFGESTRSKG
jgi:hypothetical protein